ncbi:DUF3798 domain-containing protein [Sporosalibacterium faouarense]|uniref:DUF3798 domain-containing protein n=1 Tax=Sporosalibacterium faouarense TaxID=516123 RepID=UPI00141C52CA|nr:DUF3798 domain-containing protein [Sporosalibacterium faouarense]MTI49097.1 DUF3798 domain-containing protein [Bacillota bacterium]
MFKKGVVLLLSLLMIVSLAACGDKTASNGPDNWKIGIMTGTVSQNEEEYRAAQEVLENYGEDRIVLQTYPDQFMKEQETVMANVMTMAADPDVKAIVIVQGIPGTSAAIDKVRETREDILFIVGTAGEDPQMISKKADVVFQMDELGMGPAIPEQAKKQGAEVFVHYSFPRHMSYALLAARKELFKARCEELGMEFVDATAPDPTSDAGVSGAQQFILEDVPRKVAEYGKNTAFFSTNCSMQEPLIKAALEEGAIYPQPCCPSPFHGFPGALGIEIPNDKKGDIDYVVSEITDKVAEKGGTGRFSTWPVPMNMMFVDAGVEYAKAYIQGETDGKLDVDVIKDKFTSYVENHVESAEDINMTVVSYLDENTDTEYENYLLVLSDFIDF